MDSTVLFGDKLSAPDENELAVVLGRASILWNELKRRIASQHDPVEEEWVFSDKKRGWALRLKQKKRAVLYMKPGEGYFKVSLAFGEKAVEAAHQKGVPATVQELVDNAPKYPEGRGVRMDVRSYKDVGIAVKLAAIKMAN